MFNNHSNVTHLSFLTFQTHPLKSSGPFNPRGGFPGMANMRGPNPNMKSMMGDMKPGMMGDMKPGMMGDMKPGMMGDMKPGMMGSEGSAMNSVAQWVHQQNQHLQHAPGGSFSPGHGGMGGSFSPPGPGMQTNRFPSGSGPGPNWQPGGGPGPLGAPEDMLGMALSQFGPNQPFSRDLLQTKVPNENLTPEQFKRREEQLASLRKIQEMLFPDQPGGGGGPNMGPGPGMMGPGMNPNMGPGPMQSPPGMPMGGGMGSPGGMMSGPMGPGPFPGGPGGLPHDWENLSPAQREWYKLQQQFVSEKRQKAREIQMHQMGPMGNLGGGPPPPYGFPGMRGRGPMSPTSPPYNGAPMGGPSPGPGDQFIMGPRGPTMMGPRGMGPGFDPIGPGPGAMFPDIMEGPRGKMPVIHRAGNPERMEAQPSKPPPSYQASQKRKRSGDDLDDLYKKLQPAPSPQQFSYLNQFEGHELTITKQLNMAYQEGGSPGQGGPKSVPTPASQASDQFPQSNQSTGASTTGTSVASPLPTTTTAPVTTTASVTPNPASPVVTTATNTSRPPSAQAGGRLSHYPPPGSGPPGKKDSLSLSSSNITSASLANLAKGVEHLSNQMQQNMMQGGPFHNIQVQYTISIYLYNDTMYR